MMILMDTNSTSTSMAQLPKAEFGFPGLLRDRLVGLILDGTKTATAALLQEYLDDGDPLPEIGARSVLVDSNGRDVAILTTTEVKITRLGDVTDRQAIDEGKGDVTASNWRRTHEDFWNSPEYRRECQDPGFAITDDTLVVLEHFAVTDRLAAQHR